jgi:hypothetical protein
MSRFVRTLNVIKTHRSAEWLTPSQAGALLALKEVMRVPGTVNLCGPAGVGKTFLAWVLADTSDYAYFPHLTSLSRVASAATPGVIIDNADPGRLAHRNVLKVLQFEEIRRAVVITRQLVQDYTYYVELSITEEDWDAVCDNLKSVGCPISGSRFRNLWYLVNPSLRRT